MNIRGLEKSDIDRVKELHERFYKTEFDFPDFFTNFLCAFVVENDGGIITAGGVRNIPELVLVTDKNKHSKERYKGLFQALDASTFVVNKTGHDGIHAFVTDDDWEHILRKVGFDNCIGKALYLGV